MFYNFSAIPVQSVRVSCDVETAPEFAAAFPGMQRSGLGGGTFHAYLTEPEADAVREWLEARERAFKRAQKAAAATRGIAPAGHQDRL